LFSSLKVDAITLEKSGEAIFRYLRICHQIPAASTNNLPFLNLPIQSENQESKKMINRRE